LKPAQLSKLYSETLGDDASEGASKADMIAAILEAEAPASTSFSFGNQDKEKKYDLSKLKVPEDHYVVRHFSSVELANGQKMEDPSTNRFQVYDKETFENLSRQPIKDGKQVASQFNSLGLNVDILHDPTK
jgi:hypothetical protein